MVNDHVASGFTHGADGHVQKQIKLLFRRVALLAPRAYTTVLAYSLPTALLASIALTTVLADR